MMKKLIALRSKWIELDSSAKNVWIFGFIIICFLLGWQAYSNYDYHNRQALKKSAVRTSDLSRFSGQQNPSALNGLQTADSMLGNSLLPQTNRNLGLEDLKADFDNTRQVVIEAKDELRQMSEQNKQLQAKILLLEQTVQTPAHPVGSGFSQAAQITTSNTSLVSGARVSMKSNLPPPVDFNQDLQSNSSLNSDRWTDSDSHLNSISSSNSNKPVGTHSVTLPLNENPLHLIHQWSAPEQETKSGPPPNHFVTIPATSVIDAVMLSGINARTSATGGTTGGSIIAANNVGSPFISRVKGSAILPNGWRVADLTDCFLSGTGIGILSTERANVTADKLTCISSAGLIFEAKIKAYGVDLDGIQGLSGRLVTKQGSILAKEAAAGMFAGVGTAFSPQALPAYSSNATSGSQQGYVMPNASLIAGSAVGQGVSTSLGQLSKFYLDYARQMFPIVEVNAGTRVSWVVQESFDLLSLPSK